MRTTFNAAMILPLLCSLGISAAADTAEPEKRDYPFRPVPFTQVHFSDAFWLPRIETNRTATIPFAFKQCEDTGRVENFKVAASRSDKQWVGDFGFDDTDVYKVIEVPPTV